MIAFLPIVANAFTGEVVIDGINYFMKPYLFLDIILQFVFQIPFDFYIKNNEKLKDFNNILGLAKISDYSSSSSTGLTLY